MSAVLALEETSSSAPALYAVPEDPAQLLALARSFGPLREVTPAQAPIIRAATDYDRRLLPKWQRLGDGIHEWVEPADYAVGLTWVRGPVLRSVGAKGAGWRTERVAVRRQAPHINWRTREHWTDVIVPAAVAERPEALQTRRGGVRAATFLAYCHQLAKHANERTGRRCLVRVDKLAAELSVSKATVQRCQLVAEQLGLYVVLRPGRMLTEDETYQARAQGSYQRGMVNDAALVIPDWLPRHLVAPASPPRKRPPVDNRHLRLVASARRPPTHERYDTPTSGELSLSLNDTLGSSLDAQDKRSAGTTAPAPPARASTKRARSTRKAPSSDEKGSQRRSVGPSGRVYDLDALQVARDLVAAISWLSGVRPGSIEPMLRRFATRKPGFLPWTAGDFVTAIDQANARLGRASMTRELVKHPHGLLASYLRDLEPDADHPRFWYDPATERSAAPTGAQLEAQLLLEARQAGVPAERLVPPSAERRAAWAAQIRDGLRAEREAQQRR